MSPHSVRSPYFSHIDGLRGLAVLSVLLFHLDIPLISGGFTGVDVFFVISGFLITSHIRALIEAEKFSLIDFYARRARRLLPALAFTLVTTLIVGLFLLSAPQLEQLSKNTLHAFFSVANIAFWLESGYFDSDAALKPLLHTWSLSVEEQFYLVWPVYLLLFTRRWSSLVLIVPGIISLIIAQIWLMQNPSLVFFMMPFRICEFALGALAYYFAHTLPRNEKVREALTLTGLLLVITPLFVYDHHTLFPGATAIVPALGAALIIYGGGTTWTNRLLGSPLPRFIGLISYSTYLIHWPLIVFYKYAIYPTLNTKAQIGILCLSLLIGYLMYRWIETPFRQKKGTSFKLSGRHLSRFLGAAAGLIIFTSILLIAFNGWPQRLAQSQLTQSEIDQGKNTRFDLLSKMCDSRKPLDCKAPIADIDINVLILGDSHAPDALNMLLTAFPDRHYVMDTLPGGCPPFVPEDQLILSPTHDGRELCIAHNTSLFTSERLSPYSAIVISVYFNWYKPEHLHHAVERIRSITDVPVIVFGNYIVLSRPMAELINQQIDILEHPEFVNSFALYEDELKNAAETSNYTFVSKRELLCSNTNINSCRLYFSKKPFSYDSHHLSLEAGVYLGKSLQHNFPSLLNNSR